MILTLALEKLYVYKAKEYPELFYYYAIAFNAGSTLKLQGMATPELVKALVEHLEKGSAFECTVEQAGNTLKLVQLLDAAYKSKIDEFCGKIPPVLENAAKIEFLPKQIILRKRAAGLFVVIKSEDGTEKFGTVDNDWVFWYLTAMRDSRIIEVLANENRFYSNGFDPENKIGPNQVCYGESEAFKKRTMTTAFDNSDDFYFAQ